MVSSTWRCHFSGVIVGKASATKRAGWLVVASSASTRSSASIVSPSLISRYSPLPLVRPAGKNRQLFKRLDRYRSPTGRSLFPILPSAGDDNIGQLLPSSGLLIERRCHSNMVFGVRRRCSQGFELAR